MADRNGKNTTRPSFEAVTDPGMLRRAVVQCYHDIASSTDETLPTKACEDWGIIDAYRDRVYAATQAAWGRLTGYAPERFFPWNKNIVTRQYYRVRKAGGDNVESPQPELFDNERK